MHQKSLLFAYLLSINSYIFVRHVIQILTNRLFYDSFPGMGWLYFVNGLAYFSTFLCGCLMAGLINKKFAQTILHGSLATAAGAVLNILIYYLPREELMFSITSSLKVGGLLGAAGSIMTVIVRVIYKKYR